MVRLNESPPENLKSQVSNRNEISNLKFQLVGGFGVFSSFGAWDL